MILTMDRPTSAQQSKQALLLWCVFFLFLILFNGTVPFLLGIDLHAWTQSRLKSVLFGLIFYAGLFLVAPLVLIKGWKVVRQPAFLLPVCLAVAAITLGGIFHWTVAIAIAVLGYLHRRFDLSGYGIRSRGWKGDVLAVLVIGVLGLFPLLMGAPARPFSVAPAVYTGLERWFANPAASFENLFYFGFLTERLSYQTGRWLTPVLIGLMYTAHEMSNPEYWYGGMNFVLVFVGIAIWTGIYLWRRSAVVIWLGDGLYRLTGSLF